MIVACTGHVEEQYIKKAWNHKIDEVIPKPINVDILKDIFSVIVWKIIWFFNLISSIFIIEKFISLNKF